MVRSRTLQSEVPGPHPDGHGHPETTSNICFYHPNNFCFNNIAKKSFPGTPLGQVPDLAVRGAWTSPRWSWTYRNNLKQLLSSSPTTFASTTLPKNHFLGHTGVDVLLLAVRCPWTSPRWSWTSRNNFKYLFSSTLTAFVPTTLPNSHSLGIPLVRSQTLQSKVPGPHPDVHGHPKTT